MIQNKIQSKKTITFRQHNFIQSHCTAQHRRSTSEKHIRATQSTEQHRLCLSIRFFVMFKLICNVSYYILTTLAYGKVSLFRALFPLSTISPYCDCTVSFNILFYSLLFCLFHSFSLYHLLRASNLITFSIVLTGTYNILNWGSLARQPPTNYLY